MANSVIRSHICDKFSFYSWKLDVWADFMTRGKKKKQTKQNEVFNTWCQEYHIAGYY